jgi:3D (Asp-Asp-Asp) domain-containing protein
MNTLYKIIKKVFTGSNFLLIGVIILIFIFILFVLVPSAKGITSDLTCDIEPVDTKPIELIAETLKVSETAPEEKIEVLVEETSEEPIVVPEFLGEFLITYYCSCEKCCNEYALNRPVVNGREIVFTATSAVAQDGITVAVDPTKIPYGTVLYIKGVGYRIAQDCGGVIKGSRIDVYVDSHEKAIELGKHMSQVYIMPESN